MRLHGLDLARFLAFFGMVLVNFRIVADVNWDTSIATQLIDTTEGRAAALFVILAGIGMSLGRPDHWRILKRAAVLFCLGMLNQLIFPADIIHYYALYFIVGVAFLNQSSGRLIMGSIGITLIGMVLFLVFDFDRGWNWETLEYTDFWSLTGFLRNSFFNGFHPIFPWASFLVIGLWIGRLQLSRNSVQMSLIVSGLIITVFTYVLETILIANSEWAEMFTFAPIPPNPLYVLTATGSALFVLGCALWITPKIESFELTQSILKAGRMSLTLYFAHILLGMGFMETMGWVKGYLSPTELVGYSTAFCIGCVAFAVIWMRKQTRGPLEWVLFKLT